MKRNEDFSIFKGLGIMLMVVGHSVPPANMYSFVYLFHMALFYFSAGYFFKASYAIDYKWDFVKKRIKGLYKPSLKYGIIFVSLHNIFYYLNFYNVEYPINNHTISLYSFNDFLTYYWHAIRFSNSDELLGAYWFLRSLFICSIMFLIIYWFSNKISRKHTLLFVSIAVFCAYILGWSILLLNFNISRIVPRELIVCLIFYLGYMYNHFEMKVIYNKYLLIISFLLLVFSMNFVEINIVDAHFQNPIYFIFVSVLGCYFIMGISKILKRNDSIKKFVKFVGDNTLEILTYHLVCFKLVSLIKIYCYNWDVVRLAEYPVIAENNTIWWVVYVIVGVCLPLSLVLFREKLKVWIKRF